MDIKEFLKNVAENTPTPGGGSVTALVGALSASLLSMVAGVSINRGTLEKGKLKDIKKESSLIQQRLYRAIDEDAKSYEAVIKAFRLPKETKKERIKRGKEIEKAYQKATLTPKLICEKSIELMRLSKLLIKGGNPNALSDVGISAILADSAFTSSLLNININLSSIKDERFKKRMNLFINESKKKRDRLINEILGSIKKLENKDKPIPFSRMGLSS